MQPLVRIGTRRSLLALTQSGWVQRQVAAALGAAPEQADEVAPLVEIVTTGDRQLSGPLTDLGGKALFTKEIEEALLEGRIDMAVHSMKDVPAGQPEGLVIAAVPVREDPRDAFVSLDWDRLEDLPEGARLGTASLRRKAQALAVRPDLDVQLLRGNVDTRLRKLNEGEFDAILLAAAGLNRLGRSEVIRSLIDPLANPPAPGQGALALQTRLELADAPWLKVLHHGPTEIAVAAERGALEALEGNCRTAIGAHARLDGSRLRLTVEALAPDGSARWRAEGETSESDSGQAFAFGRELGLEVKGLAGDRLNLV
ncbi:hydroxymethylbilane synthase [Brevundimonas sp. 2R-24]|uniref:Porphobilinogen deaminase n=1 Tax=Peiella sedimenti TaxID=3061083 RepID=A0ABT8SLH8_9CAUL|nr:hydroxymethylbilane synthase [Caulobacteraceae bacterium XZ-24]